jgi:ectoine hydroxylase-related dioxygenase (phytanoyl-CoA dioxygenase family)
MTKYRKVIHPDNYDFSKTKTKTQNLFFYIILFIVILFILFILYHLVFNKDVISSKYTSNNYDLNNDGLTLKKQLINKEEIDFIKNECNQENYKDVKEYLLNNTRLQKIIKREIGDSYVFQDYILVIKKSAVHTCHRDYNGDFFNDKQGYKSYTMLIYLEDMEKCLGVVPTSHKNPNSFHFNLTDPVVNVVCDKGDALIFDANLIHVGALNKKDDNLRIQLKITHKDDLEALSYYENYNKVLKEENHLPLFVRQGQRKLTCLFPGIADWTQKDNIDATKKESNSSLQQWFSYLFYGNKNFYNLKNAF